MPNAPVRTYGSESDRAAAAPGKRQRLAVIPKREFSADEEILVPAGEDVFARPRRGVRVRFEGGVPHTKLGRIFALLSLLLLLGGAAVGLSLLRDALLHDPRFVLREPSSISLRGNRHLLPAEVSAVFAHDIGRTVLRLPLDDRRRAIEAIPWVEHATVMRLLPDQLAVRVRERTPVAFVRQGGHIGLVDANGVLLEMTPAPTPETSPEPDARYSFPVVTGILATDPLSIRAARMRIFSDFTHDLDSAGDPISHKLSEVDLSNPEDVKALIPDNGSDILVHFGDTDYLKRYQAYESHLGAWKAQYPKLASVDMRYERQVVLEMQPGAAVPLAHGAEPPLVADKPGANPEAHKPVASAAHVLPSAKHPVPSAAKPATKHPQLVGHWTSDGKFHAPAAPAHVPANTARGSIDQ